MSIRNLFVYNKACHKVFTALSELRIPTANRSPGSQINTTKNFSTTPVYHECIKFKNHDDFVKKVFVENELPVVVDFHAEWCEPSKVLTQNLLDKLEFRRDIGLVIVNVESNIDLVHTFEVKAVPAILAVKNGLVIYKYIGLMDSTVVESIIERMSKRSEPAS